MFKVQGHTIAADEIDILETLKAHLALNNINLFNRGFKRSSKNIQFCCPIHNDGQERRPSCGILTEDHNGKQAGTVNCFVCDYTSNLETMVSHCFGYDDHGEFGKEWVLKNFMTVSLENRRDLTLNFSREPEKIIKEYVSEEELETYRFTHPYAYKRKLTDEIIERFDVGYDPYFKLKNERGKVVGVMECITFPVRDETGGTLFLARRGIDSKFFHYPDGVDKPLYGLYELDENVKEVIVCESILNALTCYVYGKPAVALNGTGNDLQYEQLNRLKARKLILALDPDNAGTRATLKLREALKGKIITELIYPEYGKNAPDINDFTLEEFNNLEEVY